MSEFILPLPAGKKYENAPLLLPVSEMGPALPVLSQGDMQGFGSWLHVPEYICPSGRLLIYGTPSQVAEAISADERVASIVPMHETECGEE
ncbi:hypothetical protein [Gluconobacter oxydans]|uniref:hypothetical protein n=1 Tax=Gluconobacter oxydans TaxID=442 RepID=UPI00059EAD98|nr:hypothetical protein [Gluconobacter oxydans]